MLDAPVPEWWFIGPPLKAAVGSSGSEEFIKRKEDVVSNRIEPAVADGSAASPLAGFGTTTSDLDAPAVASAEAEVVAEMIAAATASA